MLTMMWNVNKTLENTVLYWQCVIFVAQKRWLDIWQHCKNCVHTELSINRLIGMQYTVDSDFTCVNSCRTKTEMNRIYFNLHYLRLILMVNMWYISHIQLECIHFKDGLNLTEMNYIWVGKAQKCRSKEEGLLTLGFWQTCYRNKHYWEWYRSIVSLHKRA